MTKTDRDHPSVRRWWRQCDDSCTRLWTAPCKHVPPPGTWSWYSRRPKRWSREQNRIERGKSRMLFQKILREDVDNMPSGSMYHRPWMD